MEMKYAADRGAGMGVRCGIRGREHSYIRPAPSLPSGATLPRKHRLPGLFPLGEQRRWRVKSADLVIAANTVWVVVAAVFVMFMQAGFALLEAGLTRMKNAAHIAGKNVLTFGLCSLVYWAVGFGLAFGDGKIGHRDLGSSSSHASSWGWRRRRSPSSPRSPARARYFFEVVFAGVSVAIVRGAMAERAKLWVYFAFGAAFTLIYSVVSHWVWHSDGWLFSLGMQDFAGSTVHYQGALAALAGALLLGPRIGRFGTDGRAHPIPGHNMPYAVLGTIILWFGWFGFNPGSTLGVVSGDRIGYFGYVALTTNLAAAAGAMGGIVTAWLLLKRPDISMMLNGVIAALVAVTAASGFVAPWAAVVIGLVAGAIAVVGVGFVERIRIDDPIGAVAVHGMAGVWGTLATGIFARARARFEPGHRDRRAHLHGQLPPARRSGGRAARGRRLHLQRLVRRAVGMKVLWDPRRARDRDRRLRRRARRAGYPEFYPRLYELERLERVDGRWRRPRRRRGVSGMSGGDGEQEGRPARGGDPRLSRRGAGAGVGARRTHNLALPVTRAPHTRAGSWFDVERGGEGVEGGLETGRALRWVAVEGGIDNLAEEACLARRGALARVTDRSAAWFFEVSLSRRRAGAAPPGAVVGLDRGTWTATGGAETVGRRAAGGGPLAEVRLGFTTGGLDGLDRPPSAKAEPYRQLVRLVGGAGMRPRRDRLSCAERRRADGAAAAGRVFGFHLASSTRPPEPDEGVGTLRLRRGQEPT